MQYQKIVFTSLLVLIGLTINIDLAEAQRRKRFRTNNGKTFSHQPRAQLQAPTRPQSQHDTYRTIDGTMNNVSGSTRMEFGATDIILQRSMDAEYGATDELNDMAGENRVSARMISNAVSDQDASIPSAKNLSALVFTFGQFLDHDISLTPEGHVEYEPILIPANDPTFTTPIPFFRSAIHDNTGTNTTREQTNLITSWIDGSNVYGSDQDRADWLRTFQDGKLKTSAGNLLPYNTVDGQKSSAIDPTAPSMAGDHGGTTVTFVAGDIRAAEQPGLTSLHTLFVREHNRICDVLMRRGIRDDEQLYQMARKQVGAELQSITFNEFLPALGIRLENYEGYDSRIQPDISNLFATAAYRLGHTMVTEEILLKNDDCTDINGGSISLFQGFFNTAIIEDNGIEPILKGLSSQVQEEIDTKVVDNLRVLLFGPGAGLDLVALNIQRGRDHGLPDYNTVRKQYTRGSAQTFQDITRDPARAAALESVYPDLNDIDLWVGLLAEDPINGSSVGPTMMAILRDQFTRLRDGDFYYYMNDPFLDGRQLNEIRGSSLGRIINRNSDLNSIPTVAFFAKDCSVSNRTSNNATIDTPSTPIRVEAFPNPTTDNVRLRIDTNIDEDVRVEIFNTNGKKVKVLKLTSTSESISMQTFADGVYYFKITQGNLNKTIKVIKANF